MCLFDMSARVGGRVHSLRRQGPRHDLVVEAGAYRFALNDTCIRFGNYSFCVSTPLTKHLVVDALKLPTKAYNPTKAGWDHALHKIVDAAGNDAGYLTFVEKMAHASLSNLKLLLGKELASIGPSSLAPADGLTLVFADGAAVTAKRLALNLPQRPLLRLLAASPSLVPADAQWPAPLTRPLAYPIVKLYLHYDDAWWINDLGLRAGSFNNSQAWHADPTGPMAADDCLGARQAPYPLQGAYHDGDYRCDRPGPRACRGFLQAAYMGDPQAVRLYEQFHLSGTDSAVALDPATRPDHRFLLEGVHAALLGVHEATLKAKGAYERVAAMQPSGGVASVWSDRAAGLEAGCHMPREHAGSVKPTPAAAIAPLAPWAKQVFVVNEAFGTRECWAEGSLVMAENAAARLGLPRPAWLPQDLYEKLLFKGEGEGGGEGAAAERVHASDLAMAGVAARAGRLA